jgi:hypothetical protein
MHAYLRSLTIPDGTRRVRGRVWHPHTRTRPFFPPPPPAPIPAVGYRKPPDPHPAGFARPDGYPLAGPWQRRDTMLQKIRGLFQPAPSGGGARRGGTALDEKGLARRRSLRRREVVGAG